MEETESLEKIIKSRSTQRKFAIDPVPSKEDIQRIIEAGIFAAFPGLGTDRRKSPRSFIVIKNGTQEWKELKNIMLKTNQLFYRLSRFQRFLRILNRLTPLHRRVEKGVIKQCYIYARMAGESRGDFAHFDTAPFWIFIAERRHMPFFLTKLARQSMGHCLQNIWLMVTKLGMILQPISSVYQIQDKKRVCHILGLDKRGWEMDSFLVGFPFKKQKPTKRNYNLEKDIIWHI
jgi:nitroreductase